MTTLLTVGHGTASADELAALLTGAGVQLLIDIRRFPGSRAHPMMRREEMERWLPDAGIDYRWDVRLGGRRSLAKDQSDDTDAWWQVKAFRAYAAYTRTPDFDAALGDLLDAAGKRRTVICCSESLWWRCHRRLVSDVLELTTDLTVWHLGHNGRLSRHTVAEGARRREDGAVVWDGAMGGDG
ncbi:MAG TPA: DUF488 domain-containing protein [Actinomycetales bacterium]|nr:DUF488 domain-containing protein [Actinomycetales bacterium]